MWTKSGIFRLSASFRARANGLALPLPAPRPVAMIFMPTMMSRFASTAVFDSILVDEARIGEDAAARPGYTANVERLT